MPDIVDWSELDSQSQRQNSSGGIRFLKLESGKTYELRFVGQPLKFFKYFIAGKSAIVADDKSNIVKLKYGFDPSVRFAINALNRADGQVYVVECPPSLLRDVADWGKARKTDPGGRTGANFQVVVTGKNKMTRYKAIALDIAPFTDAEKEYLKANIYDLNKIYKATPDDQLEDKLALEGGKASGNASAKEAESVQGVQGGTDKDLPF